MSWPGDLRGRYRRRPVARDAHGLEFVALPKDQVFETCHPHAHDERSGSVRRTVGVAQQQIVAPCCDEAMLYATVCLWPIIGTVETANVERRRRDRFEVANDFRNRLEVHG